MCRTPEHVSMEWRGAPTPEEVRAHATAYPVGRTAWSPLPGVGPRPPLALTGMWLVRRTLDPIVDQDQYRRIGYHRQLMPELYGLFEHQGRAWFFDAPSVDLGACLWRDAREYRPVDLDGSAVPWPVIPAQVS